MNSLSSKPFAKKTFYIDLKGFLGEKKLIKDLELLGGKQEVFLSKTVSFVVSNRISLSEGGSPSTPLSSVKSISPYLFKDSSLDNKDSPASNSPIFETKHHNEPLVPLSRGMSVLQKAREKCQGNNKFVIDICKQWNIKVYPIQKVLTWIEKYKAKYFKHGNVKSKQELSENHITKLYSPFIKIEDKQRQYKPRYKVFSSWVESIDSALLQLTSKLALNFKQLGNIDCSTRLPLKEIFRQPPSQNGSFKGNSSKAASYNISKVTSNSVWVNGPSEKHTDKSSRSLKTKKEKHAKKRKVYCEICRVHYNDGEPHYEKNPHARFLNNSENYKIVQEQLDALPTVEDFLNSILAEESAPDKVCEGEKLDENLIDKCLTDSCMTEEYTLNENDYISASCSSGGSPLPFLEKEEPAVGNISYGKNLNPSLFLPKCYDVPLNLVNDCVHAVAPQNGNENTFTGHELNSKLINGEDFPNLQKNYMEISRKENCFEYNLLTPNSVTPDFTGNFNGNETNISCLEQTSSVLPLSVINWNSKFAEQPLDLSNYSMNNENIVSLCNDGRELNMNDNFACVTGKESFNSVNEKSEDGGFDSDPNLAGLDAVINNCLEEVTKSLVNDTSTAEEDGSTNELKFPDPNVVECNNLRLTCADSVPQAESFKEHLVEDQLAECDAAVCVNKAHPEFSQSGGETVALLPLESSVTSKEEREDRACCSNQDKNMACDKDVSEPLNSGENSERLDVFGLADFVKCVQAKVSPELLDSDDAYFVLDEADNSFKSVKDLNQASEETNTVESSNKMARFSNENETRLVNVSDNAEYSCQEAIIDCKESNCSVKRASESEETTCKRMKTSLNDYKMDENSSSKSPDVNVTVRDEESENIAQYPLVSNDCEPCVQISPICDHSCPNESLNSSYSSSWESSPSSSSEGNGNLLAGILPCISAEDTDTRKAAHIVYLGTTSNPLQQGTI